MAARNVRDTNVYQFAFELAMLIFEVSKSFPREEKYSLTDQVRRSSRSVCANLAEAYRKKQYRAHFIAKISDADMENAEPDPWLQFAWLVLVYPKKWMLIYWQKEKKWADCYTTW